jgi:hypothetical protein
MTKTEVFQQKYGAEVDEVYQICQNIYFFLFESMIMEVGTVSPIGGGSFYVVSLIISR